MKKIGVFGGTFDPPHLGHLILATEAQHQLGLDSVLWVLTPVPPHKPGQPITALNHRLAMLELALGNHAGFEISPVEIDRPPPHYSAETVEIMKNESPGSQFTYLIGGDSLRNLHTWHKAAQFVAAVDRLGVMRRPGEKVDQAALENILPGVSEKVDWVRAPLLEIASRDIRKRVREGMPYQYFLPVGVYEYIREKELYMAV